MGWAPFGAGLARSDWGVAFFGYLVSGSGAHVLAGK